MTRLWYEVNTGKTNADGVSMLLRMKTLLALESNKTPGTVFSSPS